MKNNPQDQLNIDYIRVNLLAKLGSENMKEAHYREAVNYLLEYFELMNKNSFVVLNYLNQPCYFNIALAYSNLNEHVNAVKYWTKFIQNDNNNLDAYYNRFMSFLELDKLAEAITDIDRALKINPNRADLYINKGITCIRLKNINEARKALLKAKELGNSDAEHYILNYC